MLIDEIYAMEGSNETSIHLIRDRKFFQAYEKSAYHFVNHLREYRVHHKFVKKIGADLVYLGFPDSVLENLKSEALDSGYEWKVIEEDKHIEICGLQTTDSFEKWKSRVMLTLSNEEDKVDVSVKIEKSEQISQKTLFLVYREFYDLTLYLCRLTCRFHRNYKFGLGDKLREECVNVLANLQCVVQSKMLFSEVCMNKFLIMLQIRLRLLLDLRQITEKQWVFVNLILVKLQKLLGQNPINQGLSERTLLESNSPLAVSGE